jgi:hypothetical protein
MAESWFCCLNWSYNGLGVNTRHVRLLDMPEVQLDTSRMGYGVVIVKNGHRICGTGAAIANAPIAQNKAYFEAKLQSSGVWGIGLATRNCDVQKVPLGVDADSWVLRHDGTLYHEGSETGRLSSVPEEGDIIGMTYDHVELKIYLNGRPTEARFLGIRGTVFPIVYVDEGAILDMKFSRFYHEPPEGFEQIMIEKSLL